MTTKKYILGAGPTGLLTAIGLYLHGIPVTLVGPKPRKLPAMVLALHPKNYQYLKSLGINIPYKVVTSMKLNYYKQFFEINTFNTPRDHLCFIIKYDELLQALLSKAYTLNIPWVQKSVSHITKATITIDDEILPYDLLAACDGVNSRARDHFEIKTKDIDFKQYAYTALISHTNPIIHAHQAFSQTGTLALLPTSNTHRSALIWAVDIETSKRIDAIGIKMALSKTTPLLDKILKVEHLSKQYLIGKIASHYHQNNLFLIGSALHHVHPLAGIGFNLAISDIQALIHIKTNNMPYQLYTSYRQDAHTKAQILTETIGKRNLPSVINKSIGILGQQLTHTPSTKQLLFNYIDEICLTEAF